MPITHIPSQTEMNFAASTLRDFSIRIQRLNPFGAASFVVYETNNPGRTLAAGTCPALSAAPNFVEVMIRQNVAFTVQSLDGELAVEEPGNR
ncbi:hypothetical protein [Nannocystis pusilla]|uniref:Uncharacterized protein n=1 Tax=Nannocystis pusilla TaxID=889268 RepID=A0ABS7U0A9_9BACT|nr:hypothetical protein [Nannocystis pusilla]MBZ5713889.1 hypothetical protein [Nannocystis pusilla]